MIPQFNSLNLSIPVNLKWFVENAYCSGLSESALIRAKLITKYLKPFKLKVFRGVRAEHIEILTKHGIRDTEKMLEVGKTRKQ